MMCLNIKSGILLQRGDERFIMAGGRKGMIRAEGKEGIMKERDTVRERERNRREF